MTPGTSIGPYEIVGWLGAGGMGEVYRARDPRLARDVAIKLIPETLAADPSRLHRFEQEARAAGQLNHPNILAVHDVGTHAGSPYIVSELLEGESLREILTPSSAAARDSARTPGKGAALPLRKAIDYARQIAEGLAAAHDKGIVHRDLKPDNLFITRDGRVKILDFGIAKLTLPIDDAARPTGFATDTAPGMVVGTVGYMSPEQVRGEAVDARSDLFSFGAVLYEMLTGRLAFSRGSGAETIAAILKEEPPEPLPATASPALARIVSRCLEKTREARFQSARDLAFGLEVLSGDTAVAPAPAIAAPPPRWRIALGIAAVVLGLAAAARWLTRENTPPPRSIENLLANATITPVTSSDASEQDAVISPDGKLIAFLSDREGPFHVWLSMVGTTEFRNLTPGMDNQRNEGDNRSVGFSANGSEVWINGTKGRRLRLVPLFGGAPRSFLHEQAVNVAWSRDGRRLAYFLFANGDPLFVADGDGSNPEQITMGQHNHFPAWSVDDKWIYYSHGTQAGPEYDVWRIPSSDGKGKEERLTHHNSNARYVTPIDARTVLYVAPDEDKKGPWLWALDVERKATHRVSGGLERYLSVSASADGRRLAATVASSTTSLWSLPILKGVAEEGDVRPHPPSTTRALAPRFGKGSTLFYLSSSGPGDGLWRLQDGKPVEVWKASDGALEQPAAVSPAGDQVALVLRKQGKRYLTVVSADGATRRSLSELIDVRGLPAWSPDAKWIVTGGNDADGPGLFIIPVDGGPARRLLKGPAFDPVWSPLGTPIVYAGQQTAVAPLLAVDPDGRDVNLPAIRVPFGAGGRARFLPDGKGLVFLQSAVGVWDFWLLDMTTLQMRAITKLSSPATIFAFDVAPDGSRIVFDRIRENSDIRLIDLK